MNSAINRRIVLTGLAATSLSQALPKLTHAAEPTVVEMLNKHPEDRKQNFVFYPRVLSVQAGETVLFKSVDKGHNSASIEGMIPNETEEWDSKLNDDVEVTFDKPGFYGYKCTPHASVGMVGLIVVEGEGKLDNLEAAQSVRQRGRAKKVWEEIWQEAEEAGLMTESTA